MINQILYSLRILFKYRLYSGISLIGLGIAISSFWFITNFVKNSHQYDAFHQNHDRIYRLTMEVTAGGSTDHYATTGKPLGSLLTQNYSGISVFAKMNLYGNIVVQVNDELFKEEGFFNVNPGTLDVFTFDFLDGDKTTCFANPNSILLSRSLAEKYFNKVEVVDQEITIDEIPYNVKGVFEDWPENSHLDVSALFYSEVAAQNYEPQDWFDLEQYNYVLLDPANDQNDLNNKLAQLKAQYVTPILEGSDMDVKFNSQALNELYFEPGLIDDVPKGNLLYIHALAFAGLLVLLIAGLNYINLSLTQSTQRTKEILLKKILGISRKQLLLQSVIESWTMTLLVLMISAVLIFTFNNVYFEYTSYQAIDITRNWLLLLIILFIIFVFGLLGTSYSGVHLSFSSPLINKGGTSANTFKKVLLGFQFAITSVILIATLTMNKQVNFMKNKDLGFSKQQVLIVGLPDNEELKGKQIEFREQIKNFTTIKNASLIGGGALPGEENGKEIFQVIIDGHKAERVYNIYRIDENYCGLLDIKFASGRNFQTNRLSDKNDAVIINESLAKSLNWENPLDKIVWYGDQPRKVIGVVQNFHNKSLHNVIEPIVFIYDESYASNLLVKANTSDVGIIKSLWGEFFPNIPLTLTYFDQYIDAMYAKEDHLFKLLGFFSIVALALCCMGLFAIFSLHVLQKTKEMSIRKVLGANALNLLKSVTRSYVMITFLAICLAIPVAWLFMNNWLDEFSYKIQLDPIIFVLSASLILFVSFIALSYHVVKILNVNPVDSLKYE